MASLTSHYSITTVGDNDKAAPELELSRQDGSRPGVQKEGAAHVHRDVRARRRQEGILKVSIRTASDSSALLCKTMPRCTLMMQNLTSVI